MAVITRRETPPQPPVWEQLYYCLCDMPDVFFAHPYFSRYSLENVRLIESTSPVCRSCYVQWLREQTRQTLVHRDHLLWHWQTADPRLGLSTQFAHFDFVDTVSCFFLFKSFRNSQKFSASVTVAYPTPKNCHIWWLRRCNVNKAVSRPIPIETAHCNASIFITHKFEA